MLYCCSFDIPIIILETYGVSVVLKCELVTINAVLCFNNFMVSVHIYHDHSDFTVACGSFACLALCLYFMSDFEQD